MSIGCSGPRSGRFDRDIAPVARGDSAFGRQVVCARFRARLVEIAEQDAGAVPGEDVPDRQADTLTGSSHDSAAIVEQAHDDSLQFWLSGVMPPIRRWLRGLGHHQCTWFPVRSGRPGGASPAEGW
jgi:hypothetical protein